jgi:hypothetical protein
VSSCRFQHDVRNTWTESVSHGERTTPFIGDEVVVANCD